MSNKSWKVKENNTAIDLVLGIEREVVVEQVTATPYNSPSVKLQLNIDAHASYDGRISGKHYEWARAGSIVAVDSLDAPYLLEKRIKSQSCCNGSDVAVFLEIN